MEQRLTKARLNREIFYNSYNQFKEPMRLYITYLFTFFQVYCLYYISIVQLRVLKMFLIHNITSRAPQFHTHGDDEK